MSGFVTVSIKASNGVKNSATGMIWPNVHLFSSSHSKRFMLKSFLVPHDAKISSQQILLVLSAFVSRYSG